MKYIVRIILSFFSIIIAIFFLIGIIFVYQNAHGQTPYILGYTAFINTSTSMLPKIKEGDLVIVKKMDSYEKGDVISFMSSENMVITHRITAINGNMYDTKGDNNTFIDGEKVSKINVYGKMVGTISGVGNATVFVYKYKYYIVGFIALLTITIATIGIGVSHVRKSRS